MKPLKILLANNTLSLLAGSETWTFTLAIQLKEMGHDVSCFSPELGIISDRLQAQEIKCFNEINTTEIYPFSIVLEEKTEHFYDVIIANHNHIVDYLRKQFPKTPIISTIHGIIHLLEDERTIAPEHPALSSGVNQFVAVSEEVMLKLKHDYSIDSKIIRNFFDIKKFSVIPPPSETPKQFLINTNYSEKNDPVVEVIREVAKYYGAKVAAIGQNFAMAADITKAITDADVVFGMGRSVLEGVAAGRLGIVHGRWGTGGVICEENINEIKKYNFSGRNSNGKIANKEELIKMIDSYYTKSTLEWGKNYIAREHNVVFAAEEFIRLARELTGEIINKPKVFNEAIASDTRPFKRAS